MITFRDLMAVFIVFILWMAVGPMQIQGRSLEQRYHEFVNSPEFHENHRRVLWTVARPLTWTGEKISEMFAEESPSHSR